jgi:hypothetical protein
MLSTGNKYWKDNTNDSSLASSEISVNDITGSINR